jgi:hypothetical protein
MSALWMYSDYSDCHEHCECEDVEQLNFAAELSACGDAYENGRDIS